MKKINSGLLALVLMSVGFVAVANGANNNHTPRQNMENSSPRQHMGKNHNMVYSVTEQTTTPNETIKKLSNNAPKIEDGKRYVIKIAVIEVPENSNTNTMPAPLPVNKPVTQ